MDQRPGQEKHAAHYVHDQVPDPGGQRPVALSGPDQEHGAEGQDLPEDEKGDEIPGENRSQGAPGVDQPGRVLEGRPLLLLQVDGEQKGQEGREMKQVAEQETQLVHPHQSEGIPEDRDLPEGAGLDSDEARGHRLLERGEGHLPGPIPEGMA